MRSEAELNSLFGRVIVENAIARRVILHQWENSSSHRQAMVIRAMQELEPLLKSPHDAVAFCQSLDANIRDCIIISLVPV